MPELLQIKGRFAINCNGMRRLAAVFACLAAIAFTNGCAVITVPYHAAKDVVEGGVWVVKKTYAVAKGTTRIIYKIGEFTFEVVRAPVAWALTHEEIQSIDGLPVKEAIRQDRVKSAPYVVGGARYVPMSPEKAKVYREEGLASWYGYESGRMTANGEAFNPNGLSAAHKYLPIPTFVKVTNLENRKFIIVRVNDRGPFPSEHNAASGQRIIDLSMGAAKRLEFFNKGVARVRVEAIQVKEE
jgi:rare lipoprotein A